MPSTGFGSIDDLLKKAPTQQSPSNGDDEEEASRAEKTEEKFQEKMEDIRLDTLEEDTMQRAQSLGMPHIELSGFPIGPEVISLIPEDIARAHQALAFFRLEDQIRVGVVNPDDPDIPGIIQRITQEHERSHVTTYLISQHSFDQAVRLYKTVTKVKNVQYGVRITAEDLERFQKELDSYETFEQRIQQANMTEAFAMIISMALNAGSSDIHIEAEEKGTVIRFRIDGVLMEIARLSPEIQHRLVSRIKGIAELKINIDSIPQDGRITIELGEEDKLDIRVSTLPSAFGESVVFRLLKSSAIGLSFGDLGMRPLVYERLKKEIEKPNGMVITTGPTGSGKTTTLYAILNTLNTPETKIITLENPVEYKLKGIVQSQIDHAKDYTFALGLRAILRQDPDIIMVGEIRDFETAQTAIDAALTGHLMLSTIHTNDAAGVIPRFLGMGVQGIFLAPALNAVIGQRLVRRVHADCKEPYTPSEHELDVFKKWIDEIPENSGEVKPDVEKVVFYKGKGCDVCRNTGYKGRVGIYEVFTMTPQVEEQILSGKVSEFQMKDILHEAGMVTMGQDGMLKVIDGMTTIEEVLRVSKE